MKIANKSLDEEAIEFESSYRSTYPYRFAFKALGTTYTTHNGAIMNTLQIKFDELKNDAWSDIEANNVRVVCDFFQKLINEHDFDYILANYDHGNYTQHNRAIPPQIPGLVSYVKGIVKRYPDYAFDVKYAIASGDRVVLHSHATFKAKHRGDESKGFIIMDIFRLEDGRLVEHWDAIQPIDAGTRTLFLMIGGSIQNDNPTF